MGENERTEKSGFVFHLPTPAGGLGASFEVAAPLVTEPSANVCRSSDMTALGGVFQGAMRGMQIPPHLLPR